MGTPTRKAAGSNPVGRTIKRPLCVHAAVFLYGFWFVTQCVTNQIIYNMILQGCLSVDFLFLQTRPKFAVWGGFHFHGTVPCLCLIPRDTGRLPATRALLFSQPHCLAEFLPDSMSVVMQLFFCTIYRFQLLQKVSFLFQEVPYNLSDATGHSILKAIIFFNFVPARPE